MLNKNQLVFFTLLKAGLWEKDVLLSQYEQIDFKEVFQLAEEQSVIGLVTAGIEHVTDIKIPQEDKLLFVGSTLQIEQQNLAMNSFIAKLFGVLYEHDMHVVLVKGQGVAECYEKPQWRACGDIDLLLDKENYKKAKIFLSEYVDYIEQEDIHRLHLGMEVESFLLELHGSLRSLLSKKMDRIIDDCQFEVLNKSHVRIWNNSEIDIYIPAPLQNVIIVFSHILQHFFQSGIGLRQICDWCRLLWHYHDELDTMELQSRIYKMGVINEWKAFSSLAVDYLGMPVEVVPFYSSNEKWKKKASRIVSFILETGNFGHNRDISYMKNKSFIIRKLISLNVSIKYSYQRFKVFPRESAFIFCKYFFSNVKDVFE